MHNTEIRHLLKRAPFEPIRLGLSDGRSILIRHRDQVVVSQRHVYVGLTRVQRSKPLATPRSGDVFAPDWLLVDLSHITTVEPADGEGSKPKHRKRK